MSNMSPLNQIYKFILSDELSSSLRHLMMIIISPQGQDMTGVTWMLCSVLPIQELEFGTLLDILLKG